MRELTMTFVDEYRAGSCNIGPAEIARRRMAGHVGAAITLLLGAFLLWADPPTWMRLALFFPAAGSAAGYIQAATRFCADYGWRGVFNFGDPGLTRAQRVADEAARRSDRRKALLIAGASAATGVLVALAAMSI